MHSPCASLCGRLGRLQRVHCQAVLDAERTFSSQLEDTSFQLHLCQKIRELQAGGQKVIIRGHTRVPGRSTTGIHRPSSDCYGKSSQVASLCGPLASPLLSIAWISVSESPGGLIVWVSRLHLCVARPVSQHGGGQLLQTQLVS